MALEGSNVGVMIENLMLANLAAISDYMYVYMNIYGCFFDYCLAHKRRQVKDNLRHISKHYPSTI